MRIEEIIGNELRGCALFSQNNRVWFHQAGSYYPYFQGCDPGVSFISAYHPQSNICSVLVSNYGDNVWKLMRRINEDTEKAKNSTS